MKAGSLLYRRRLQGLAYRTPLSTGEYLPTSKKNMVLV
jgi:hypothetical protein